MTILKFQIHVQDAQVSTPTLQILSGAAMRGARIGLAHAEIEVLLADTPKGQRHTLNAVRVALAEARVWDEDSVRRIEDALDIARLRPTKFAVTIESSPPGGPLDDGP